MNRYRVIVSSFSVAIVSLVVDVASAGYAGAEAATPKPVESHPLPPTAAPISPVSGTDLYRTVVDVAWPEPTAGVALAASGAGRRETAGGSAASTSPRPEGQDAFWAWDFETGAYYRTIADVRYASDALWLYVESGRDIPQPAVDELAILFETQVAPRIGAAFDSGRYEDDPAAVTLLLLDIPDPYAAGGTTYVSGYFLPVNQYRQAELDQQLPGHHSNEREMLYLDVEPTSPTGPILRQTLAHEYQHLIQWNHDRNESPWLDEALSELAVYVARLGHPEGHVRSFLSNPSGSLLDWTATPADYGFGYLFLLYQLEHTADRGWIKTVVADQRDGIPALESAFGGSNALALAFRDFSVALFHDDATAEARYAFLSLELGSTAAGAFPFPAALEGTDAATTLLPPWSVGSWRFRPGRQALEIAITPYRPVCLVASLRAAVPAGHPAVAVQTRCSADTEAAIWAFTGGEAAQAGTLIHAVAANPSMAPLRLDMTSDYPMTPARLFSVHLPLSITSEPRR